MDINHPYVFQCDSVIVNEIYNCQNNYLLEESNIENVENYCCIYFSSNDIYYPNKEEVFKKRIIEQNSFEWYGTRIDKAKKHIFIRDVYKQWYIHGINAKYSSPQLLLEFLKNETVGYRVITIGSSAGGYAAVLYGSLLNAQCVFSFNGQFEISSLLNTSTELIDPLVFRNKDTVLSRFYDINQFVKKNNHIFYFYSNKSKCDVIQLNHIKSNEIINRISFNTNHHGIPFLKCSLKNVINSDFSDLEQLKNKTHNPILFSIQQVGLLLTFKGLFSQILKSKAIKLKYLKR